MPRRMDDLDAIRTLLAQNGLHFSDINAVLLNDFVVAEDVGGALAGSVGLEQFGRNALLGSLGVARNARNGGLGCELRAHAEDLARKSGVSELWLLTTTASEFFGRAGYLLMDRSNAPAELQISQQFAGLCPATSVCMLKK